MTTNSRLPQKVTGVETDPAVSERLASRESPVVASKCPVCDAEIGDDASSEGAAGDFDVSIPGFDHVKCPNCGAELRRRHSVGKPSDWWEVRPY